MDKMKLSKTYKIHTLYNENIYQGMWSIYTTYECQLLMEQWHCINPGNEASASYGLPNVGEICQIDFSFVHFLQSENKPKYFKKIWSFLIRAYYSLHEVNS